jgi:hypothetical protein
MDPKLLNNIRNILGIVTVKKQLNEYLENKEIHPNALIYPPLLQDIPDSIPEIANKVEIIPFMEELDPTSGFVKVGWNMFVMGTNRKFLGYTVHESLNDLQRSTPTKKNLEHSLCYATGDDVVSFIVETLQKYNEDNVALGPMQFKSPQTYGSKMPVSNAYYEKNKSVGRST